MSTRVDEARPRRARRLAHGFIWALGVLLLSPSSPALAATTYSGLFTRGTEARAPDCGITWSKLEGDAKALSAKGFRVADIDAYEEDGVTLLCATWVASKDAFAFHRTASWAQFYDVYRKYQQSLGLIDFEVAAEKGVVQYMGVWLGPPRGEALVGPLDWGSFGKTRASVAAKGMRLSRIEPVVSGKSTLFAGIFEPAKGGDALVNTADEKAFLAEYARYAKTLELVDYDQFSEGETRYYLGVWRATSGAHQLVQRVDWDHLMVARRSYAAKGMRLAVVVAEPASGVAIAKPPPPPPEEAPAPPDEAPPPPPPSGDSGSGSDIGSSGSGTGGAAGGKASPSCRVPPTGITTCSEAMGRSAPQIAGAIRSLQTGGGTSCCEAIAEAQRLLGSATCQVVAPELLDRFGCGP